MAANTLNVRPRSDGGKGVARKLRAAGQVPGVLYGHGDETRPLSVDAHDLELLLAHAREGSRVSLTIEGGGTADVLIREVQQHPYRPDILHVDFQQLHANETIKLQIPVRIVGSPVGVHSEGGVLDQVMHDLDVECLPRDIPDGVEVDVSALAIGDSIRVQDLSIKGVKILHDDDVTVAHVLPPTVQEPEEGDEPAAGEPEVIRGAKTDGE